ncbi:hypothetical protein D3C87_1602380 [compost metagenome]
MYARDHAAGLDFADRVVALIVGQDLVVVLVAFVVQRERIGALGSHQGGHAFTRMRQLPGIQHVFDDGVSLLGELCLQRL